VRNQNIWKPKTNLISKCLSFLNEVRGGLKTSSLPLERCLWEMSRAAPNEPSKHIIFVQKCPQTMYLSSMKPNSP